MIYRDSARRSACPGFDLDWRLGFRICLSFFKFPGFGNSWVWNSRLRTWSFRIKSSNFEIEPRVPTWILKGDLFYAIQEPHF